MSRALTTVSRIHQRKVARAVSFPSIAAVAALALAACSGGSGSQGQGSGANATYVSAVPAVATSADPTEFGGGTRTFASTLNSMLFNYDSTSCDTPLSAEKLKGNLAKSWTQSADLKTYDVVLNDTYKSESGNPLTADDVKWSVERGLALSPIVKYLDTILAHYNAKEPITVVSPKEFKLNVDSPTPMDLALFTVPTMMIYDSVEAKKHATTADPWAKAWLGQHTASFGPWKLDSITQNDNITLSRNKGFGGSTGNISRVILKQIDPASQSQLLQSGSVQYAGALTWDQYKSLQGNQKTKVYPCAPLSRDVLIVNFNDKALGNVKVRQAISMALHRDELNKGGYAGLATPSTTGLLPGEMPPGSTAPKLTEDVAKAKQLMSEAGYPNGFDMELQYNENQPGAQVTQTSILVQNQLKAIGINVKLNHVSNGNDFNKNFTTGKYQAVLYYSGAALPSAFFDAALTQPGSPNDSWGFKDPAFTALVNKLGTQKPGSSEYNATLNEIATYNVEQLPWIPLIDTPNIFATSSTVADVDKAITPILPQQAALSITGG